MVPGEAAVTEAVVPKPVVDTAEICEIDEVTDGLVAVEDSVEG